MVEAGSWKLLRHCFTAAVRAWLWDDVPIRTSHLIHVSLVIGAMQQWLR
jgi:hypothetical protein